MNGQGGGKMEADSFPDEIREHQDKWVALSNDEKTILAADASFDKALAKAQKKGEKNPVMLKVPSNHYGYVL